MPKHINKLGNSYVVYIPKDIVMELGWSPRTKEQEGTPIVVEREGNRIIIRRFEPKIGGDEHV